MHMEEYIEHHGIKGMRWGVRKQKTSGIGRKKRSSKQKEQAIKLRLKTGERFIKQVAPAVAGATVSVALASAGIGVVGPIASAAVSTSLRTVMAIQDDRDNNSR